MKNFIGFLILFLFVCNTFVRNYARAEGVANIQFTNKDSTEEPQILVLKKNKKSISCLVSGRPERILSGTKLKSLEFPLKNMKSTELCRQVIVWSYKGKKSQSCYFTNKDFIINDILFECYN